MSSAAGEPQIRQSQGLGLVLQKARGAHGPLLLFSFPEAQYLLRGPRYLRKVDSGDIFVDQKTYHERLARLKRVLFKRCVFAPEAAITDWAVNTDWNGVLFFGNTHEWGVVCGFMRVARAGTQVLRERKIAVFREQKDIPDLPSDSGSPQLVAERESWLLTNMSKEDSAGALRFAQSILARWQTKGSAVQRLAWDPVAEVWQADCRLMPVEHDAWETTTYNVSWDAKGGVVVRIVEIVGGEAVDLVPASILESYAEAAFSMKPEGPLAFKMPTAGVKTVRFWPWAISGRGFRGQSEWP